VNNQKNKNTFFIFLGTILLLCFFVLEVSFGQENVRTNTQISAINKEQLPFFSIELIVFEYNNPLSNNEIFIQYGEKYKETNNKFTNNNLNQNNHQESTDNVQPTRNTSALNDTDLEEFISNDQVNLELLRKNELSMKSIYDRLFRLSAYRPIVWGGWKQKIINKEKTPVINIKNLGHIPQEFKGTFQLYLSDQNRNHLVVNLSMTENQETEKNILSAINRNNLEKNLKIPLIRYQIQGDKIIGLNDIHYFDHPKFGIIVKFISTNNNKLASIVSPESGNVFTEIENFNKKSKITAIDNGIVGLSKMGKYISLTLNSDGNYITYISDQIAIDMLAENSIETDSFGYSYNDGSSIKRNNVIITITGKNDPPISEDNTVKINDDYYYNFTTDDFKYSDIESDLLEYITIKTLPNIGLLQEEYIFASSSLIPGIKIYPKTIDNLYFRLPKNYSGVEKYTDFTFSVNDGTVDSISENTITIELDATKKEAIEEK
jgi:VCBS repeat-containing protein